MATSAGPAITVLRKQHTQLVKMLSELDKLGVVGTRVVNSTKDDLIAELRHLEPVLRTLADTDEALIPGLSAAASYPFPIDAQGRPIRDDLQGPEYMRRQRTRVQRLGVRILDHTPALELLVDADGVVSGAVVLDRASGRTVHVEAGAVVLATGGCAFKSKTFANKCKRAIGGERGRRQDRCFLLIEEQFFQ